MRTLAWFAGSFSAGIFLAQYLLPESWQLACAWGCLALGSFALLLPGLWRRRGLLAGTALALALGWNWLYVRQVQAPMEQLAGTETRVVMTLCDYAVPTDYGAKVTVRVEGLPGKAVYYGPELLLAAVPGQTATDTVQFQSAARIRDDDITSFTSKGVFLLAYQRGELTLGKGSMDAPRWWPVRMGCAMRGKISALFPAREASFLSAILTGDRSGLSEESYAALSEAGLVHILAVSGMHCGFLLTMVTMIAGRHRRRLIAACTIPLLAFYALLTGGSPSVVRACVMLTLLLAAPLVRRDSDGATSLGTALFLILLANPFAAASISLQLSFAAMAGILFLTGRLYRLLNGGKRHGRIFAFTVSGFSATMGALVFTVPLSALYFGTLSLISPLSNLLCLWAASAAFISGLAVVAVSFAWMPLAGILSVIPGAFAGYILWMSGNLAQLPYHAVSFANPYLKYWLALVYLLFAAAWLGRAQGGRKYLLAAALSAVSLTTAVKLGAALYDAPLDAVVLDVGQGQCIALHSAERFALVDCGSANSWYGPGEKAAQQLSAMGCQKLDYLILTHFDEDHINGVPALLARLDAAVILVPEEEPALMALAQAHGAAVEVLPEKRSLSFGDAALTVYPPLNDGADNERGLSVLAAAGGQELLITGDMSSVTEKRLLEVYDLPDLETLVAGHHGSRTSTSEELLDTLLPETVCISVGPNSYGHPAPEMLWRLKERGCRVYRTDLHGTIHLSYH